MQHLKAAVARFLDIGQDEFGRWQVAVDADVLRVNIVRYGDDRGPHAFLIVHSNWDTAVHAAGLDDLAFIPDVKRVLVLDAEETFNEGHGVLSNIATWTTGGRTLETGVILRDGTAWATGRNLKSAYRALSKNIVRLREYRRTLEDLKDFSL